MITYRTIFSFLLALLLGGSIFAWHLGHRDDCDRFANGDPNATEQVQYGSATVRMPCRIWLERQPPAVAALELADLALAAVFAVSLTYDVVTEQRRRAQFR